MWRPFLLASSLAVTRLLEWTTAGFFMIRPSFCKRATLRRELANEISLISLGSNQILRFPHLRTEAARRFWSLRDTVIIKEEMRRGYKNVSKLLWTNEYDIRQVFSRFPPHYHTKAALHLMRVLLVHWQVCFSNKAQAMFQPHHIAAASIFWLKLMRP